MPWPLRRLCYLLLLASAALPAAGARAEGQNASESALTGALTAAQDPLTRAAAAEGLGRLVPATPQAAQRTATVLVEALLLDLDYPVRGRAAEALGRLGPVTDEVVPALVEALAWDAHLMVRWHVTAALERIATQHPETAEAVVPGLLTALQGDSHAGVRARAAESLGTVDPGDEPVVPALVRAFRADSHPGVRWQAAASLEKIAALYAEKGTRAVVADLREALAALVGHPHPDVRHHAEGLRQAIQRIEGQQSSQAPE
jgi:HEAT repeat protein